MKASDYIVDRFVKCGITEFFGYQGTMIAHLVDSIGRNPNANNHSCYNEQGAAFAACGYAKQSGRGAVAYATSGPGAANLLSGVANAYYDSLPVVFMCGQLNSYEYTDVKELRQQGFQEMDVVSMARPVAKDAFQLKTADEIPAALEYAYRLAMSGRPGPVLIDIPMDLQRAEITPDVTNDPLSRFSFSEEMANERCEQRAAEEILDTLRTAHRPVLLIGNGITRDGLESVKRISRKLQVPILSSLLAPLPDSCETYFGFIGSAYGHRYANLIADVKADAIIALGISLCPRQTSFGIDRFAKQAKIVRVDIDKASLRRLIHSEGEVSFCCDANDALRNLEELLAKDSTPSFDGWLEDCRVIRQKLRSFDESDETRLPNKVIETLSKTVFADCGAVAVDVGQHMMWAAQSFSLHDGQTLLYSGGHGAMGFALPAAIGASYVTEGPVGCICGDGAFQMNIQELNWVARERIPMVIAVMNNDSLGLIRQQQQDMLDGRLVASTKETGFFACDFAAIAEAYGIRSIRVSASDVIEGKLPRFLSSDLPILLDVVVPDDSFAHPKTPFGHSMHEQAPLIPDDLRAELDAI